MTALIAKQYEWEERYNKRNRTKVIKKAIAEAKGGAEVVNNVARELKKYVTTVYKYKAKVVRTHELLNKYIEDREILHEIALELLSIVLPMERSMSYQSAVSPLSGKIPLERERDRVIVASEMLAVVAKLHYYTIIPATDSVSGSLEIVSNVVLDGKTKQALADIMYLPPMIVEPLEITKNTEAAHFTFDESVILGKGNHHNMEQSLDVLNILNKQQLSIDLNMYPYVEQPNKECDTPEKVENFKRLQNTSTGVYITMLKYGNIFYNTHKFDKRGRVYSQGYHIHIQSSDYKKSLINLTKKEVIEI